MQSKQPNLKLEYVLATYQRVDDNFISALSPIAVKIRCKNIVISQENKHQLNTFIIGDRQHFQEFFLVERRDKTANSERILISYQRVHRDFLPNAIKIKTYRGFEGRTSLCLSSKTEIENGFKNFINSHLQHCQRVLCIDRSLFFARRGEQIDSATESKNNVIPLFKEPTSRAENYGAKAAQRKSDIPVLTPKKESQTNRPINWWIGRTAAIGLGLFVSLFTIKWLDRLEVAAILEKPSESHLSLALLDPNNYIENDANSYYLSGSQARRSLALDPTSGTLAIATSDRIILVDTNVHSTKQRIDITDGEIQKIAIAADGKIAVAIAKSGARSAIATPLRGGLIKILDREGKILQEFKNQYPFTALSFSSDSKHIVAGTMTGNIKIFPLNQNFPIITAMGHSGQINDLLVIEERIFSASSDTTIREWNFQGKEILSFKDDNEVFAITKDSQGYIYSGNAFGTIRKLNFDGEEIDTYQFHNHKITSLDTVDNILVSGSNSNAVSILDLNDRNNKKTFTNLGEYVAQVAISKDATSIYAAAGNKVFVWQFHRASFF